MGLKENNIDMENTTMLNNTLVPKNVKILIGQRFGRLLVIGFVGTKHKDSIWRCKCDCGKIITVIRRSLVCGCTKSCGCLKRDISRKNIIIRNTIHNLSKTKLYYIWKTMRQRCLNKNQKDYKWYGAKGISICNEWENPSNFVMWAKSNGYKQGLTLDRKDFNGDYCPENCRWITIQEQQIHKRNNHYIRYKGKIHSIPEWARIFNIKNSILYERIVTKRWDIERAFLTPPIPTGKYIRNSHKMVTNT